MSIGGIIVRLFATLLLAGGSAGCTTINLGPHPDLAAVEMRDQLFLGAIRLRLPVARGNIQAADIQMLGAGWHSGPFVGWNASNMLTADPADCQLIVIIRSAMQAENAAKILLSLEGQNPCLVDYTTR